MSAITFEELWVRDYEPALRASRRRADEHRTEAMIEATLTLCGEPVRQITAHDLFNLDALGNPFICGAPDGLVTFVDCAGLIWEIHEQNNHTNGLFNLRRRAQAVQRLAHIPIDELAKAIESYLARMRLDGSEKGGAAADGDAVPPPRHDLFAPEPKTHFLVPLLVEVTAELGPTDPVSGALMSHVPLPRLIQYQRAFRENKDTGKTYTEIDSLRVKCMDRVNQINHAAREAAAANYVGAAVPPGAAVPSPRSDGAAVPPPRSSP